jgi:hypothetical protein
MVPTVELPPTTPPTLQVTAELKAPVPVTVAAHCEVNPVCTVVALHDAETDVMVAETEVSVIDAEPDFVASSVLVAVTDTGFVPGTAPGAV